MAEDDLAPDQARVNTSGPPADESASPNSVSQLVHDDQHSPSCAACSSATPAHPVQGAWPDQHEPRQNHAQLAPPSAPSTAHHTPTTPALDSHLSSNKAHPPTQRSSKPRRTSPPSTSSSSSSIPIHHAVRPQLSERDSIFASTYAELDTSPVTISPNTQSRPEGRSAAYSGRRTEQPHSNMALSSLRRTSLDFPPALQKDLPMSALSIYQSKGAPASSRQTERPSNAPLPQQYHRRSFYDLHDLDAPASLFQKSPAHSMQSPDTPLRQDSIPTTPNNAATPIEYTELEQSAEREQYRSWRKGQAKYPGMTIAESQRRPSKAYFGVDKVIDAQLPQPDPPMANARSRKASHYLGLFRENEAEEKRETEKKKSEQIKEHCKETLVEDEEVERIEAEDGKDSILNDVTSAEDSNVAHASQERTTGKLPLGLLEEIRNHHHFVPARSRNISYNKDVSGEGADCHDRDHFTEISKSQDEEWDQEHISSATYYPHQGVAPADSPTDDQLAERSTSKKMGSKDGPGADPNDVELALESEGATDYLHGISRSGSVKQFEPLPQPAIALDSRMSDSEYESDAYGYDSTASVDDTEAEVTPTATPLMKGQEQDPPRLRQSARRQSTNVPAPVGAVELKPYKHQVGGHTPVYRFSRRAVCKQLNSKENMFYETVEKNHPDLLGFMPRYIGVLNVTYRKEQRKRKQTVTGDAKPPRTQESRSNSGQDNPSPETTVDSAQNSEQTRVISHSMRAPQDIPQVIFENNRHLIPDNLFRVPPRSVTPDFARTRSSPLSQHATRSDEDSTTSASTRPALPTAASWGFTSVNEKLRDHVLREVFAPPTIHKHDRRDRAHQPRSLRKLPKYLQGESARPQRQQSIDVSSLRTYRATDQGQTSNSRLKNSIPRHLLDSCDGASSDVEQRLRDSKSGLSRSAEASEVDVPHPVNQSRLHHKRRHSGGGLKRKPTDIDGGRGDLEFHENDDEAYSADAEDVFAMEDVDRKPTSRQVTQMMQTGNVEKVVDDDDEKQYRSNTATGPNGTPPRLGPAIEFGALEPRNPETSLMQMDERVVRFLLLEDLTAGMQKPCVLDLKMGTRQYGVEANEKKQASQRMKCKTTTSRELGVRVCGMQVYNVREQKYAFEDKYYGRDLKAGPDFQAALTRFFFDGIGHAQALKHIPSILEKINQLDKIIRRLPGYRLYASSLLMIYDRGDADVHGKVKPEQNEDGKPAQYPDIKLKIVDFANCVTAEDIERVLRRPCPPFRPDHIDSGYLRGLRTLRAYFQKIYQDLHAQRHVERGEGEGMAIDQRGISNATTSRGWSDSIIDDPGEVSV